MYSETAAYGHIGSEGFSWECTDRAAAGVSHARSPVRLILTSFDDGWPLRTERLENDDRLEHWYGACA